MNGNFGILAATFLVALGLSHCVIPQVDLEVVPGMIVSDVALVFSAILGLMLDIAHLWLVEALGFFL